MSGNTLGTLFCVTSFGESHGPAIGCVVDGCPPGLAARRRRYPARARPAQARHVAPRDAAARIRHRRDPVRRIRRADDRHADRASDPERGSAQQGLRRDRGHVPPRSRRLRVLAEVRHSRLSRRRARVGARNGGARRRRRHRAGSGSPSATACVSAASWCSSAPSRFRSRTGRTSTRIRSSSRTRRIVPELEAFMDALRKSGDSCGAKITVGRERRAGRLGRARLRQARRRSRAGDDGHQCRQGRGDRRGLRERRAARQRALATR